MKLFTLIFIAYIALCAYLFFVQRSMLYFPSPKVQHPYPEESYLFDEATVRVILLNTGKKNALLYFGGNAEAVEHNAPEFIQHFPNHTVYLVQYRGYGNSTGKPTEAYLYSDALAIFNRITPRHDTISVIGRSLGSGIATFLAAQKPVQSLILVTPFDSIESVAQNAFPFFPVSLLLQDKYNSLNHAKKIKAKTLLLMAENDQIIGASHSKRLAEAFSPFVSTVTIIPSSGHNSLSYHPLYYPTIRKFIHTFSKKPPQ
ncbi:MAG TPA: alpha/beta hydrolase [Thiomicrorhabdus sp.]|nr:alpha/beta hydrolase [Thiomicrorhabdus sp.]